MKHRPLAATLAVASLGGYLLFASWPVAGSGAAGGGNATWSLRLPQVGPVVFRGVVSLDEAGTGAASFLYPAPNAGGLLAAVITHGFLVESAKKSQKDKLQEAADKVLTPYKDVLDNFSYRDLMQRVLQKTSSGPRGMLIEPGASSGAQRLVESSPAFSLTQDQNAIVLDNVVAVSVPGAKPEAGYRNEIRVVSSADNAADPVASWTANDGAKLKDESARLVAESLDIAFADAAAGLARDGIPYRTIRYREGAAEKIERAQVLDDRCNRFLLRTLRGTLMSVPVAHAQPVTATSDNCPSSDDGR